MFENLEEVKKHYEEIMHNLTIPEVVSDISQYKKLILEQTSLEPIYKAYLAFRKAEQSEEEALSLLDNERIRKFWRWPRKNCNRLRKTRRDLPRRFSFSSYLRMKMMIRTFVMEIRGGAGGRGSGFICLLFI